MSYAAEIFAAIRILQNEPAPEPHPVPLPPKLPEPYAGIALEWFQECFDDLSAVGQAADMYGTDPLELVDEPDSARRALSFARAITGSTS